jgi:hypothetical protein
MSTWTKVRDTFEGFFTGSVMTFLKPLITALESQGSTILIAAAENAVVVGFSTAGGGQAAMAAALASFSAEVVAKGLPFIESQARALIEVALQNAKAAVPAVAA